MVGTHGSCVRRSEARKLPYILPIAMRTHEITVYIADDKTMYITYCNADARAVRSTRIPVYIDDCNADARAVRPYRDGDK